MIDDKTEATTNEICTLAAITPQRLAQLEKEGVVQRAGRDRWPVVTTIQKLFEDARSRRVVSADRARFEKARAENEEMKAARQRGELVNFADVAAAEDEHVGALFSDLEGIPAAFTRDPKEKSRLQDMIDAARNAWAKKLRARADQIGSSKSY